MRARASRMSRSCAFHSRKNCECLREQPVSALPHGAQTQRSASMRRALAQSEPRHVERIRRRVKAKGGLLLAEQPHAAHLGHRKEAVVGEVSQRVLEEGVESDVDRVLQLQALARHFARDLERPHRVLDRQLHRNQVLLAALRAGSALDVLRSVKAEHNKQCYLDDSLLEAPHRHQRHRAGDDDGVGRGDGSGEGHVAALAEVAQPLEVALDLVRVDLLLQHPLGDQRAHARQDQRAHRVQLDSTLALAHQLPDLP
eukprot:909618-Rhodomonas_salina.8